MSSLLPPEIERCPSPDRLGAFAVGQLPPVDLESVSRHIDACSSCLLTLESLDDGDDPLIERLSHPATPDPFSEDECRLVVARIEGMCGGSGNTDGGSGAEATLAGDLTGRIGPYEILGPLGHGGMGAVYKARHVHLGKIVALKVLPPRRSHSLAVGHFLQEMRAVGRLNHPNIVAAHDADVEDMPYLAMEFLEGADLGKVVARRGPLAVADACEVIRQAALGLQHAHEHDLVHRDVKPSNLLLTPEGVVKVLDLGLARLHVEWPPGGPAAVFGTIDYIAPEQLRDAGAADPRADQYGLGCTLYHLLTGEPPFAAPGMTDAWKQCAHEKEAPPQAGARRDDVPHELDLILDRMLAKDRDHRFASAGALARALEPLAAESDLRALAGQRPKRRAPAPVAPPAPAAPPAPRHAWLTPVGAFFATLTAGLALLWAARTVFSPAAPLDAMPLEITHLRSIDGDLVTLGELGSAGPAVGALDSVRVVARLNQPAHCYLIAVAPDGREELCFPPRADEPPPKVSAVTWPAQGGRSLENGGTGLAAFVLVASRQPLPHYALWRAENQLPAWKPARADGAWYFAGGTFRQLGPRRDAKADAAPPAAFAELSHSCQSRPGVEAVSAVAFPVVERPPAPE